MSDASDVIVLQYRFKEDGVARRSSFSIDPVLLAIFARRMGSLDEAKAQLRRWAKSIAESGRAGERAGVSRLVHRHIYELLDDA